MCWARISTIGPVVDTRATQGSHAEERFAAPLPKLDERQILAILRLDDTQALGSQKYCNVGRRVEVRFPESAEAAAAPRLAPQ
jgi:hypothetical protein